MLTASPAMAEPPPQDVLKSVSSKAEIRDLAFGFSPSDRVFFSNVTFAIRGNELMIGSRDRHCPDGSVEFADWTEKGDLIVEDTNNLPRPLEIAVDGTRFEVDGFTLAEAADGSTVISSLRGRNPEGKPIEWSKSGSRATCILAITGNCNDWACLDDCVIDAPDCDKCHCPNSFPHFCTDGTAEWACLDNGCDDDGDATCRFDSERCICVCEEITATAGACCMSGSCTDGMTVAACIGEDPENPTGMWFGEGSSCADVECPVYNTGACCMMAGETCAEMSGQECVELNGVYHGDGSLCAPGICVPNEPGPYFFIGTVGDWTAALLDAGKIDGFPNVDWTDYMDAWSTPEEGDPYPDNEFVYPDLYVWDGGPEGEAPAGGGLVMAWDPPEPPEPPGCCECTWPIPVCAPAPEEAMCPMVLPAECIEWFFLSNADCDGIHCFDLPPVEPTSSSSAWRYALGSTHEERQPPPVNLSNMLASVTVNPPQFDMNGNQINVVSFGFQDVNGNYRAWYWNVGPVPPNTIPWAIPPTWTATTITINTAMTGVGAATPTADSYMDSGFQITQAQYVIVDENTTWIGGPNPIPPPGGLGGAWNYWYNLSIAPSGGGGGHTAHGPVSFSVNGPVDPYYEGLPAPGAAIFSPWWFPPPAPPGAGPYPLSRNPAVPQAVGIPSLSAVCTGDVNDYSIAGVASEAEIFQSEPWMSPAGPPAGDNNQILQALALGLNHGSDNVNAYTFGEDFFNGDEFPVADDLQVLPELWEFRTSDGFNEPIVGGGGLPMTFYFSVDPWAIGLAGTSVQNEATAQGALALPVGPIGSADFGPGLGAGPWQSDGEAAGDVFFASPMVAPAVNWLDVDETPMALLAPRVLVDMEDDLDAVEHVGTNAAGEPGNTHDRVWATAGWFGGSVPPCPGSPSNPNHDPTVDFPIIFSVDRGSYGYIGSAVHAQVLSQFEGASGDLFIAVTLPSGQPTNMLLIDEGQLGLMPHDDLDAVIVHLLIDPADLVGRVQAAASHFNPEGASQGEGFTDPLLDAGEAVVGFSVDLVSIGLLNSAVDYECRVDGQGIWPGTSGVMEQAGDIFYSDLMPVPGQVAVDQGTGLLFGQNYLWFEELALGLDRGAWSFAVGGPSGNLNDAPDELNALDSDEYVEPEACCFPDDYSCADLMPADCEAQGGFPQGPGTQCTAPDACCLNDGSGTCIMVDPLCCDDLGGVAQDPGTVCTAVETCCLPGGGCIDADPLCCDELGGWSSPIGAPLCLGDNPPQNGIDDACELPEQGACCYSPAGGPPYDACVVTTPDDCVNNLGGVYEGDGTVCQGMQACCLPTGVCVIADGLCCELEMGGTAQGPGTMCTAPKACCLQDGSGGCIMVDPLCCDDMNGVTSGSSLVCLGDNPPLNGIDDACECGWTPGDPHKMHWPQLPDEDGWDVNATAPLVLADDWRCSGTGWIQDFHFWGSWKDGVEGQIDHFVLSIHEDIPADQNPDGYSKPGATLWERDIFTFAATPVDPPTMEGWYDPFTGEVLYDNHQAYFQYDVCLQENDWFWQDVNTIYWLNISAVLVDPTVATWGWKSTENHFNDDAVWAEWGSLNWAELYEPSTPLIDTFWVEFNFDGFQAGGGSGWPGDPYPWFFYENTGWMNEWYYDHPFDPNRMKTIHIEFDVVSWDGVTDGFLQLTANWSTPEWSLTGNPEPEERVPPLPPLTPAEEDMYIVRGDPFVAIVTPQTTHYSVDYRVPDYNPEWVSIDVWGSNFVIPDGTGTIIHDCRQSLDLAFVVTGETIVEGACCYTADLSQCIVTTQNDCEVNLGGVYQGDTTTCAGMEACCLPIDRGTGCIDADALCCVNELGGTPQGPGTSCQPDEACCLPSGMCVDVDPLCCVSELSGIPQGVGTACTTEEACCLDDGSCIMVDPLCCDEQNGIPQGLGTECTAVEACCLNDAAGTCIMVDPLCCDEEGGVPQGLGTVCTTPEACCLKTGACIEVDPLCCDEMGGWLPGAPNCLGDGNGNGMDDVCEPEGLKWVQLPDLEPTGIDVEAMWWDDTAGILLADDFECNERGKITEIMVWGSWYHDFIIPDPGSVRFTLSFHADIPDPDGAGPLYSMPQDPPLWTWTFEPGTYNFEAYMFGLNEGFFEPWPEPGYYEPNADTICWLYTFPVPDGAEFIQEGSATEPIVYWLDVQAQMVGGADGVFGWKTSLYHWNDDAVWAYGTETFHDPWMELRYPDGHPMHPQSIDLAFMLISEPAGPAVKRPMPEDCATIAPGTRCSVSGTCTPGTEPDGCWEESHCVPPPTGDPFAPVCYAPKHRYLSIARHPDQVSDTGRRVKLSDGTVLGWVGAPYYEPPTTQHSGLWLAELQATPHYETTWPDVVHVMGCEIAHASLCDVSGDHCGPNLCPGTETCQHFSYHIQAIAMGSDIGNEANYSEVLMLNTPTVWGDTVSTCAGNVCKPPQGVVGLDDVQAAIKLYQANIVAPITWIDIDPSNADQIPNQYIGIGDILKVIDGFQGKPYPGNGPKNCSP